ncbi:MAG: transposase [Verrucomicrobiales bacterium]|nr:transposase [Verrucomicrobiales bacterium]MCP5526666.1 transposase [Verrucomicrobiales bacterium]
MPRQLRIEYPWAIYHVMSRGDRREDIFHDEVDRQEFLKTLAEACQKADFQVHAYCLMRNHFHLVVETPNGNLVAGMRWLLSSYTLRLNHRSKLFGQAFSEGACLGGEDLRQGLLDRIEGKLGKHHAGQLRAESAAAKAERIIGEELQRLGWTRADLEKRNRTAPEKLELAARLRRETTLTIKEMAQRLHLGSWKSATTRLHSLKQKREQQGTPSLL